MMKIYEVGGCVRDRLLDVTPKDKDYVVVGATHDDMISLGFVTVGADFPVYLHPETNEEYALARVERKAGRGYMGFDCETSGVTIEQDLMRRDVSINSMAVDPAFPDKIIDPFNGMNDLKNKILRHTSESFMEDPVRILRIGRFLSRYKDFSVAEETRDLSISMVESGELKFLTKERVWKELERVLSENAPYRFFEWIESIGATKDVFGVDSLNYQTNLKKFDSDLPYHRFASLFLPSSGYTKKLDSFLKENLVPNEYKIIALRISDFLRDPKNTFDVLVKWRKQYDITIEAIDFIMRTTPFMEATHKYCLRDMSEWKISKYFSEDELKGKSTDWFKMTEKTALQNIYKKYFG